MELSPLIHQPALIKILIFFLIWVGIWLPIAVVSAILLNWHPSQSSPPSAKNHLIGFTVPRGAIPADRSGSSRTAFLFKLWLGWNPLNGYFHQPRRYYWRLESGTVVFGAIAIWSDSLATASNR